MRAPEDDREFICLLQAAAVHLREACLDPGMSRQQISEYLDDVDGLVGAYMGGNPRLYQLLLEKIEIPENYYESFCRMARDAERG